MSHAASSGYGSARSNNRIMRDIANARGLNNSISHQRRSRNSFLNSLRRAKLMNSASLFRSLRLPRVDSVAVDPACYPTENTEIAALPCQSNLGRDDARNITNNEKLQKTQPINSLPVPAPRFQTLKRHAYQNIPIPIKQKSTDICKHPETQSTTQLVQVRLTQISSLQFED